MATPNKPIMESIAVKTKGFAEDVYRGIAKPTVGRSIKNLNKQVEQVTGEVLDKKTKKLMVDAGKVAKKNSEASIGYKFGNFLSDGIRKSTEDYKKTKSNYQKALNIFNQDKKAGKYTTDEALKKAKEDLFKQRPSVIDSLKMGHTVEEGGERFLNPKAVAGTAMAVGITGRVITGGGLYRDQYGNFNAPGIPFI